MAKYFEWMDSYSVGIAVLDDGHKDLLQIANQAIRVIEAKGELDVLERIVIDLVKHTRYHFRAEEDLMRKTGFDGFEAHVREHDRLFDEILDVLSDLIGHRIDPVQVGELLIDWILTHIQGDDRLLSDHLHRHGIS